MMMVMMTAKILAVTACYFPYELLDQHLLDTGAFHGTTIAGSAWQSFRPGKSELLSKMRLRLGQNSGSDTNMAILIKIYDGEGNTGNLLYQDSYVVPNTSGWKDFAINNNVLNLVQGQQYSVEVATEDSYDLHFHRISTGALKVLHLLPDL